MNELHENTPDLSTALRLLRQAIIRALAVAAHEHMRDNHWLYYFEALDRLLAPVCKALTTLTWELMESSSGYAGGHRSRRLPAPEDRGGQLT
jgi:hypothetical protein